MNLKFRLSACLILFITILNLHAQNDTTKAVQFTGIPTINYNNSFGLQLGAMAMLTHHVNRDDTISPPSSLFGFGFYTTKHTWFGIVAQRLFWNQDNWRAVWALGMGDINFQFYTDVLPGGVFIDYTTTSKFAYGQVTRRVYDRLYTGALIMANKLNTEFYLEDIIGWNPDSLKTLAGIGIPITWDSRDNVFNATEGLEINFRTVFNQKWMGSDLDFNTLSAEANYYYSFTDNTILATRATFYTGLGEVPFEGLRAIGRDDIRGYSNGKHRGDELYTIQTEYRHSFQNRFGYVAFIGLAMVKNNLIEEGNQWSPLLPGLGAGIRFMAIEDKRINVGIDAAIGKEDWGLYFRLGEAF